METFNASIYPMYLATTSLGASLTHAEDSKSGKEDQGQD